MAVAVALAGGPTTTLTGPALDALVAVAAAVRHAETLCSELRTALRVLILAGVASGRAMQAGYRLRVTRVTLPARDDGARHYQERLFAAMQAEGRLPLDLITDTFGRTSSTLRFQCRGPPGPRFAWPGRTAAAGDPASPQRSTIDDRLDRLRADVDRLASLVQAVFPPYRGLHPLLSSPETQIVLDLLLTRVLGVITDAVAVVADLHPAERELADKQSLSQLARRCAPAPAAPHPPPPPGVPPVPGTLLLGYGQLVEDSDLLRRMAAFDRARLIPALERKPGRRWEVTLPADTRAAPGVSCRLAQRRIVDYHHAYRTLFPERYAGERRAPPVAPGTTVWQTRIYYQPD